MKWKIDYQVEVRHIGVNLLSRLLASKVATVLRQVFTDANVDSSHRPAPMDISGDLFAGIPELLLSLSSHQL